MKVEVLHHLPSFSLLIVTSFFYKEASHVESIVLLVFKNVLIQCLDPILSELFAASEIGHNFRIMQAFDMQRCIFTLFNLFFSSEQSPKFDLAILTGTTADTGDKKFSAQKALVKSILKKHDISKNATLVAYVSHDTTPMILSRIGDVMDKKMALMLVDAINNKGRESSLDVALMRINNTVFSTAEGARPNTPRSILLFVDSKNTGDIKAVSAIAKKLKDEKTKLVIIGMGKDIDRDILRPLAYDKESIFFPPDLESMEKLTDPITKALKPGELRAHFLSF